VLCVRVKSSCWCGWSAQQRAFQTDGAHHPHPTKTKKNQELWKLAQAKKLGRDVLITDKTKLPNFKELVRSSKFCLAPWGHGWGNRLGLYMAMGCVPVIVQVRVVFCVCCLLRVVVVRMWGLHTLALAAVMAGPS
jgi:hypothetical protein